jgi:hypothetical protein
MDIEQWKQAAIRHFKSGGATDEHWQVMASCLLHASESEGLDGDLDQIIDPNSLSPPSYPEQDEQSNVWQKD